MTCDEVSQYLNPDRIHLSLVTDLTKLVPATHQQQSQDDWSDDLPGEPPEPPDDRVQLDVHLLHVVQEPVHPVHPGHQHHLQQSEEEEVPGWSRGIEECEHVNASIAGEGET